MPRCIQSKPVQHKSEGIFQWGYSYVFHASDLEDRSLCEDKMFAYLEKRSSEHPEFKAAVWQHFDDPNPCGKHTVVGDHYHVVTTRQVPQSDSSPFTPMGSAFGCWIRHNRKLMENKKGEIGIGREPGSGKWLEGPKEGIVIFSPEGLFRYLRTPPRTLCFFTQNAQEFVFEKGDNKYMHHLPINRDEPLPFIPGLGDTGSGKGGIFNLSNAKSKTGQYLFGLMSLIHESRCSTIEQFQAWTLNQDPAEASRILEKYVSRANFGQSFQKALEWYTADHANKSWEEQLQYIMPPAGVKFMSVERSLEMFNMICKWNHFERIEFIGDCIDVVKKSKQKVNTLLFIGASNAGKSQIAQSLALTFSKVARIYQGQNNNFIFQSAIGRGVILHQEALFAKPAYEIFKLVMEGALTEVAVKGKPNALLPRIPYIITCNVIPWAMADPQDARAFENRCLKYEFQCCPRLRDFREDGDINPEMWNVLYKEYQEYLATMQAIADDLEQEEQLKCSEVMPVETRSESSKRPLTDVTTLTPEEHAQLSEDASALQYLDEDYTPASKKFKRYFEPNESETSDAEDEDDLSAINTTKCDQC